MPAKNTHNADAYRTEGFRLVAAPTACKRPARLYLPSDYQPKYAYPLVVLFHDAGQSEADTARLVTQLSRRNYIVLCVRGSQKLTARADGTPAFAWSAEPELALDALIAHVIAEYSVCASRVFFAGIGAGATAAFRLGLALGDRVAGVIALNGELPPCTVARGLRVFVGYGTATTTARRHATQLRHAGAIVRFATPTTSRPPLADLLRQANRWIMETI